MTALSEKDAKRSWRDTNCSILYNFAVHILTGKTTRTGGREVSIEAYTDHSEVEWSISGGDGVKIAHDYLTRQILTQLILAGG